MHRSHRNPLPSRQPIGTDFRTTHVLRIAAIRGRRRPARRLGYCSWFYCRRSVHGSTGSPRTGYTKLARRLDWMFVVVSRVAGPSKQSRSLAAYRCFRSGLFSQGRRLSVGSRMSFRCILGRSGANAIAFAPARFACARCAFDDPVLSRVMHEHYRQKSGSFIGR
jgi:hypothetical protein